MSAPTPAPSSEAPPASAPTPSATASERALPEVPARIARFLAAESTWGDPSEAEATFAALALEAFAFQFERIAGYRRYCEGRGATPATVGSWREVPFVPTAAWRSEALGEWASDPAVETFRSSGTSAGPEARSVHRMPYPALYEAAIDASFPRFVLSGLGRPAMLSLVPSREILPDSSLSFMIDRVLARFGGAGSDRAVGPRGVEVAKARSWAGAMQRRGQPLLVLATSLALDQWLTGLERQELRFRFPAGSAIFDTGGLKGREGELTREELLERIEFRLGVAKTRIVREYGMTELSSQCYGEALSGGDPDRFVAPPWVRVRVLDPATLTEAREGEVGLLAIFDLANVGSAVHVLTEDLGVAQGGGFRLVGRAAGAELRGCSLAALELAQGGADR